MVVEVVAAEVRPAAAAPHRADPQARRVPLAAVAALVEALAAPVERELSLAAEALAVEVVTVAAQRVHTELEGGLRVVSARFLLLPVPV